MNLFLEILSLLSLRMLPIDLKSKAGFICVTTLENKLEARFSSCSPSRKERSSGKILKLLADKSRVFNCLQAYKFTRLLGLILLKERLSVSKR